MENKILRKYWDALRQPSRLDNIWLANYLVQPEFEISYHPDSSIDSSSSKTAFYHLGYQVVG